jgi:hypothetical protein
MEDKVNTVQEFINGGGRIFRRRSGKRTITIAYKRSPVDEKIMYGATIHNQDSPSDTFIRKPHNRTAVSRCEFHPVIIPNFLAENQGQVEDHIRHSMFKNGCKGEAVSQGDVVGRPEEIKPIVNEQVRPIPDDDLHHLVAAPVEVAVVGYDLDKINALFDAKGL